MGEYHRRSFQRQGEAGYEHGYRGHQQNMPSGLSDRREQIYATQPVTAHPTDT
jgi:hypothetical protein